MQALNANAQLAGFLKAKENNKCDTKCNYFSILSVSHQV